MFLFLMLTTNLNLVCEIGQSLIYWRIFHRSNIAGNPPPPPQILVVSIRNFSKRQMTFSKKRKEKIQKGPRVMYGGGAGVDRCLDPMDRCVWEYKTRFYCKKILITNCFFNNISAKGNYSMKTYAIFFFIDLFLNIFVF